MRHRDRPPPPTGDQIAASARPIVADINPNNVLERQRDFTSVTRRDSEMVIPVVSREYRLEFLLNPEPEETKNEDNFENHPPAFHGLNGTVVDDYDFGFGDWDDEVQSAIQTASNEEDSGIPFETTDSLELDSSRRTGRTNRWIGGYQYTRADTKPHKIYYRCSYYRSTGCKGKCHFVNSSQQFTNFVAHTCGRSALTSDNSIEGVSQNRDITEAMKTEVDRLAVSTSLNRRDIWDIIRAKFFGDSSTNTAYVGLTKDAVLRRVNRTREEELGGSVFGQIEVPPWSQILNDSGTATGIIFFLFHYSYFDKVKKRRERLLGWGHPILVNMLKHKKTEVFVDGTFKSAPKKFKQCFIISTYDRPTRAFYPAVFVLCTSKQYSAYFHAVRLVLDETDYSMDPEFVYCDFEAGLIRAIKDHFPETKVVGCFFHFKQACRRKMKAYSISDDECSIAMTTGVLDMLSVIDVEKVKKQGISWVQSKIREMCRSRSTPYSTVKWNRFWRYFMRTWIKRFPPYLWNIKIIAPRITSRTNNPLERFNREMNETFSVAHPKLLDFVVGIEKLARRYANLKSDIELGKARAPTRLPIAIPKAVVLPDIQPDDENGEVSSDNDESESSSSTECEMDQIRSDPRVIVRGRSETHCTMEIPSVEGGENYYDEMSD